MQSVHKLFNTFYVYIKQNFHWIENNRKDFSIHFMFISNCNSPNVLEEVLDFQYILCLYQTFNVQIHIHMCCKISIHFMFISNCKTSNSFLCFCYISIHFMFISNKDGTMSFEDLTPFQYILCLYQTKQSQPSKIAGL